MKEYRHVHRLPLSPARLMKLIDEDPYREFLATNLPNLIAIERLEFRWEGEQRIKRIRMQFDTPLPALIKRALPGRGRGWVEETNILYPAEGRMEAVTRSAASQSRRVTYFRPGTHPEETERITEGTYRATVPVVGGALERFMARQMEKHKDTEFDLTLRYLREQLGVG